MIGEVLGVQNGEVILGKGGVQKWPNMAGLSALQNGPKQLIHRWLIIWNHNVSIWILLELFSQKLKKMP